MQPTPMTRSGRSVLQAESLPWQQRKSWIREAWWQELPLMNILRVAHILVDNKKDLGRLRSSKYVQSTTDFVYREVEKYLKAGRQVLFSGCGCQVGGLYGFLGKDYDNLFTIDLMCHGGPSPKVFQKYLKEVHKGKQSPMSASGIRIISAGHGDDGQICRRRHLSEAPGRGSLLQSFSALPFCTPALSDLLLFQITKTG